MSKQIRLADVKRIWEHISGRPLVSGSAAHHFAKALLEEAGVHFEDCPFAQEHNEAVLWCRPCQYDHKKWRGNPDDLPPPEPIADSKEMPKQTFNVSAHYRALGGGAIRERRIDAENREVAIEWMKYHYPSAYKYEAEPVENA